MALIRLAGVAMLSAVLTGCYTLRPVTSEVPEPGAEVAMDITDAGRVALAERVGPEVLQLQGRLVSSENGDYVLAVNTVRFIGGGEQIWSGERVRVSSSHVARAYERRFSRGRTAAMTAATVGGVVAFFVTRTLLAGGSEPDDNKPPVDPNDTFTRPPVGTKP